MTLVLSVQTKHSIWMLADRRITAPGKVVDDAIKIVALEASDGGALIGYSGIGETAGKMQPSDWISNTLRGRGGTIDECMMALAEAAKRELPRHLHQIRSVSRFRHSILAPSFVGRECRFRYIAVTITKGKIRFKNTRMASFDTPSDVLVAPPLVLDGSGGVVLSSMLGWQRPLLNLLRAYGKMKVSALTVAGQLAEIGSQVFRNMSDNTVGPRFIVAWRNVKYSRHRGGGGCAFYLMGEREEQTELLPSISAGIDVRAVISAVAMSLEEAYVEHDAHHPTDANLFHNEVNKLNEAVEVRIQRIRNLPDEKLR